jgi:phage terminase small subunit
MRYIAGDECGLLKEYDTSWQHRTTTTNMGHHHRSNKNHGATTTTPESGRSHVHPTTTAVSSATRRINPTDTMTRQNGIVRIWDTILMDAATSY